MNENEILAKVQGLQALCEEKYQFALATHHYHWLDTGKTEQDRKAIVKLQILLREVFDPSERDIKIKVINLVLPIQSEEGRPFYYGSSNELWLAEVYAWLDWLENQPGTLQALDRITFRLESWREKLKALKPVQRPRVYIPTFEEEEVVPF